MNSLYPLKFQPIIKEKIWGGPKLRNLLNKPTKSDIAGESWEISGVQNDISVVSEGFLAGNNLEELIEIYMGDLVGNKVYNRFGIEFPLLIKFIDANDVLSVQVHPDDKVAEERHKSYGKTEMWYVMQADAGSELLVGFNQEVDKSKYIKSLNENKILEILNTEKVNEGDVFFLPAGRIHAIGAGILLAEIQQTSDITYRIFDFNRKDDKGNERELHTDLAVDVIDYSNYDRYKTDYRIIPDSQSNLTRCQYFTTNLLALNKQIDKDVDELDSFTIYMCIEGQVDINYTEGTVSLDKGETVLIPAEIENFKLVPKEESRLIEVYIED